MKRLAFLCIAALAAGLSQGARAQSTSGVTIAGTLAALLLPEKPKAAIILLAGGDGAIGVNSDGSITRQGNQLVRTRAAYARQGFAVLVPDGTIDVKAAVDFMRRYGKVTLVATSRGTQRAARGIARGAAPDRLVLTAGFLSDASGDSDNVMNILGSPARLPPTLVVHHRNDACRKTLPAGVAPFVSWAKGKAQVVWLDGGIATGHPCQARGYHGFNSIDGAVVNAVAKFASP
jgi:hypothetical protein